MLEVVERYGFHSNRSDCIPCPFHDDRHPSLHIYAEPGRGFYCYACGTGGSVIDFVAKLFRLNFKQAMLRIGSDFGFSDIPTDRAAIARVRAAQAERQKKLLEEQAELDRIAAEHCKMWWTIKTAPVWSDEWCKAMHSIDYLSHR